MPAIVGDLNTRLARCEDAIVLGICVDFDIVNDDLWHRIAFVIRR
jgi:hypothetical protein